MVVGQGPSTTPFTERTSKLSLPLLDIAHTSHDVLNRRFLAVCVSVVLRHAAGKVNQDVGIRGQAWRAHIATSVSTQAAHTVAQALRLYTSPRTRDSTEDVLVDLVDLLTALRWGKELGHDDLLCGDHHTVLGEHTDAGRTVADGLHRIFDLEQAACHDTTPRRTTTVHVTTLPRGARHTPTTMAIGNIPAGENVVVRVSYRRDWENATRQQS